MATAEVVVASKTLADHLPVLQVVVPLVTSPLIVLIGVRALAWPLAFIASIIAFVISCLLLHQVIDGGFISYAIGGWAPPLGIEYRVDATNALLLFLISGISVIGLPYALTSIRFEIGAKNETLFYACYLLCFTGLLGVVITGDAFNIFVFLEISSLSTYVLVAQGAVRDKRALTAAYDYLIMGTIGATFFVIGIGMLYMSTGTLNLADIADRIADQGSNRTIRAAFAFIVVGMGLKVALVPLHLWLPNAYTFAPSAVTVFLAATSTKAAVYVLLRFMFSVYHPSFIFEVNTLYFIFIPFALLAMFAASFVAIFQSDFKRMLAYSSIAQIGYMLMGIAMLNAAGLTSTIVHMFNHGITKALLFMGVGAFVLKVGSSFYDSIHGLGRRMPITGACIIIGGLSLIGVPGTAGFISKWMLMQAAFENGFWWIAVLVVLSSLLAAAYVWRALDVIYLEEPLDNSVTRDPPLTMLIPMIILAVACVWFGINTSISIGAASTAAESLLNGSFGMMPAEIPAEVPTEIPGPAIEAAPEPETAPIPAPSESQ